MFNLYFAQTELEIKAKSLIQDIERTTKKGDARAAYKAIYELLNFGRDVDLIGRDAYQILIDAAKNALYETTH